MKTSEIIEEKIAKQRENREYIQLLIRWLIVLAVVFMLIHFVIGYAVVSGHSMVPAMHDKDFVIYNRVQRDYEQGDIVAIDMKEEKHYIKRVIGLPGDEIDISETGVIRVNGEKLEENYIYSSTYPLEDGVTFPLTVGEDELFVMGDNREHSKDSRSFGCIKKSAVLGRVWIRMGFGNQTGTE